MTLDNYADYHGLEQSELREHWSAQHPQLFNDANFSDMTTTSIPHKHSERNTYYTDDFLTVPHPTLDLIDLTCYVFFTIEFIFRFVFCPNKKLFFTSGLNIIDLLTLIPFYLELVVHGISSKEQYKRSLIDALFVMRILRIFRIFRLIRHNKGLQVLVYTITASIKEIFLLIMFLMIGILIFASLIYYTDHRNGEFKSIPDAFWWAAVTMTTVGYGDAVPQSDLGHVVGVFCAIGGVLMVAFTVPVIVNNFLLFYLQVQYGRDIDESKLVVKDNDIHSLTYVYGESLSTTKCTSSDITPTQNLNLAVKVHGENISTPRHDGVTSESPSKSGQITGKQPTSSSDNTNDPSRI